MIKSIIGIDIGGTTVKIGLFNVKGDLIVKWEIPTDISNQGQFIIKQLSDSITAKLNEHSISKEHIMGIGVGAPGFIEAESGYIYEAVNIGWKNFKLTEEIERHLQIPTFLQNDANVAVLGENWRGAGNNEKDILAITLGTGVGGGIIANGEILNGINGTAGEVGHITIDPNGPPCNCGRKGCLETLVSATGFVRQAMTKIEVNPSSLLAQRFNEKGKITTKDIFELELKNDLQSKQIIDYSTELLGMALANIAVVLNPSKILIGGGVAKAGNQLLIRLKIAFERYSLTAISESCELKLAQLGNDAGIIGAAFLVKQKVEGYKF